MNDSERRFDESGSRADGWDWAPAQGPERFRAGPRVLYVEDDPALADMYALGLRQAGYQVLVAPTGRRGLALLRAQRFAALLLDLNLPDLNGIEVLRQLRSRDRRALPVLILSNSGDSESRRRAAELGVSGWLTKSSTTPKTLAATLDLLLGRIAIPSASPSAAATAEPP